MTNTARKQNRKPRAGTPVRLIVAREFVGDKTATEALIPVIVDDLRRKAEQGRTFDKGHDPP